MPSQSIKPDNLHSEGDKMGGSGGLGNSSRWERVEMSQFFGLVRSMPG